MSVRLVSVAAGVAALVACSSHWSVTRDLDPVPVDLSTDAVVVEARVRLEQPAGEDPLPCDALTGVVSIRWSGPAGVPVALHFLDDVDDDGLTPVITEDGGLLGSMSGAFASDGPDACELVIAADLASEAGAAGDLVLTVTAQDGSAAPGDEPAGDVDLVTDLTVEHFPT